eukprot:164066-Amphidinium_carterae.1
MQQHSERQLNTSNCKTVAICYSLKAGPGQRSSVRQLEDAHHDWFHLYSSLQEAPTSTIHQRRNARLHGPTEYFGSGIVAYEHWNTTASQR